LKTRLQLVFSKENPLGTGQMASLFSWRNSLAEHCDQNLSIDPLRFFNLTGDLLEERILNRGNPCALRSSDRIQRAVRPMKTESRRVCSICGNEFAGAVEFCPVCMLRKALAGGVESSESSASEDRVEPRPEEAGQRFEHYQLVIGVDRNPVELGRGAMGVTYKAFDVWGTGRRRFGGSP
jgi:hypothetical protein